MKYVTCEICPFLRERGLAVAKNFLTPCLRQLLSKLLTNINIIIWLELINKNQFQIQTYDDSAEYP